ncbi:MAG: anhydro-N-acetylmuramic acid kinase [Rhodospirillales bacterium]|nr:anhydro-N-acetylmuramic acid kinase [Rhodospirillales bacterium]
MKTGNPLLAIGLMSGTSMDGVDAALIETDGDGITAFGATVEQAYAAGFRDQLRALMGAAPTDDAATRATTRELTLIHAGVVAKLLESAQLRASDIGVIGFHGQTVFHDPARGMTCQIGDGALLAEQTGIRVVNDFRSADVAAGGEGAPLAPVYHVALARTLARPVAILNIGGVANVTWISPDGGAVAFDTGPGNALIDDWVRTRTNQTMDVDGQLARRGRIDEIALGRLLAQPYFDRPYPKSLDRDSFSVDAIGHLSPADGAATLAAFTAQAVARAAAQLPAPPLQWLVCGGGRHNRVLMSQLRSALDGPVEPVEAVGWRGDALEAQAFAFLAVRALYGLPISYPQTTGVAKPTCGGVTHLPPGSR